MLGTMLNALHWLHNVLARATLCAVRSETAAAKILCQTRTESKLDSGFEKEMTQILQCTGFETSSVCAPGTTTVVAINCIVQGSHGLTNRDPVDAHAEQLRNRTVLTAMCAST